MVLFKTTDFSFGHSYIFMQMSVSACGTQSMRFFATYSYLCNHHHHNQGTQLSTWHEETDVLLLLILTLTSARSPSAGSVISKP